MPNIIEYSAQGEITPSDKGIQAAELAGRRSGAFGNQIANSLEGIGHKIEEHETLVDTSNTARHMSDGEQGLDKAWTDLTSDPSNKGKTDLAQSFMASHVEPFITSIQGLATTKGGKALALERGDQLRQRMWRQTTADQASMTANLVHENVEQVGNNATVSAARDPSQENYEAQIGQIMKTADTMLSILPARPGDAGQRDEWRSNYIERHMHDLVLSRYVSMASHVEDDIANTKDGDRSQSPAWQAAQKAYAEDQKGPDYVKGAEWAELGKHLQDAAQQGENRFKAKQRDAFTDQEHAHTQEEWKSQEETKKVLSSFVDPKSGQLSIPPQARENILTNPNLTGPHRSALIGEIDRLTEDGDARFSTPGLLNTAIQRAALPPTDPHHLSETELMGWVGNTKDPGHQMTKSDADFVMARLHPANPKDHAELMALDQAMKYARAVLAPKSTIGIGAADPAGEAAMTRFSTWFLPRYEADLKVRPYSELLEPEGAHSLIRKDVLAQIGRMSGDDAVAGAASLAPAASAPAGAPAKSGKSLDDIWGKK